MFNKYKKYIIPALIALQFLWIIFNVLIFEVNLATGKTVKLRLAPVDPRSLMQGDYVILNYDISRSRSNQTTSWDQDNEVRVVLTPGKNGVYRRKSIYADNTVIERDDVVINGTRRGNRIFYGIEHYFVPEGTGRDVEQAANYALVKVSAWGDAMLIKLIER